MRKDWRLEWIDKRFQAVLASSVVPLVSVDCILKIFEAGELLLVAFEWVEIFHVLQTAFKNKKKKIFSKHFYPSQSCKFAKLSWLSELG